MTMVMAGQGRAGLLVCERRRAARSPTKTFAALCVIGRVKRQRERALASHYISWTARLLGELDYPKTWESNPFKRRQREGKKHLRGAGMRGHLIIVPPSSQ